MARNVAVAAPGFLTDEAPAERATLRGTLRRSITLARRNPLGAFGLFIIVAFAFIAVFAPALAPNSIGDYTAGQPNENPSMAHWFGTDVVGRDVLSRVIFGTRISLSVAFISVLGGAAIATFLGVISGYSGGFIDAIMQRIIDTALAFPALLLLLIITQVLGPSMRTVIIAIMIGIIPGVTRVVRGAVLSERNNQYVEAARAVGAWTPRILFRHLFPNILALAIVIMTTLLGAAILAEAALSFLGLGIPDPNPSWGRDVSAAREHLPYHIPAALFPGAAITLTVLGFNLLGDAIRDIADPRLRGSR